MSPVISPLKHKPAHPELVAEFDEEFSTDELKALHRALSGPDAPTKKLEVADSLANYLMANIESVFELLSDIEQKSISEAIYSPFTVNAVSFEAKYGGVPGFGERCSYRPSPALIRLFLWELREGFSIRSPLSASLRKFVSKPSEVTPIITDIVPIEITERESKAQSDLREVLKLIKAGKIKVTEKTCQPSGNTANIISKVIGDYYDDDDNIGAIAPFAWTMLLQAAGLAERKGTKLVLTQAGSATLSIAPSQAIISIWRSWLKTASQDEFRRIDVIKGQTGKGSHTFPIQESAVKKLSEHWKTFPLGNGSVSMISPLTCVLLIIHLA